MSGLHIPEEFMMGGLQAMNATNTGFADPSTGRNVALANEFVESGFHVVATATRGAGQDTQGLGAYEEIKHSGELGHVATLEAARGLGGANLNLQERHATSAQSLPSVVKNDTPYLG